MKAIVRKDRYGREHCANDREMVEVSEAWVESIRKVASDGTVFRIRKAKQEESLSFGKDGEPIIISNSKSEREILLLLANIGG